MTEDEARRENEDIERAFLDVFATAAGKRVLFWMLEQCAIYRSAYAGEMTAATNFTLGMQEAGRKLIGKLDEIDPRLYPQLLHEVSELKAMAQAAQKLANKGNDDDEDA